MNQEIKIMNQEFFSRNFVQFIGTVVYVLVTSTLINYSAVSRALMLFNGKKDKAPIINHPSQITNCIFFKSNNFLSNPILWSFPRFIPESSLPLLAIYLNVVALLYLI